MSPFLTTLGGGSVRGFGRGRRIISGPTTAATSLSATPASTSVQLSWTNTNATAQIRVYRAATLVTTLSAASTTYTNTGLSSSTSYSYTVVYIENGIEGPASNTATTTTLAASGQMAYTTAGTFTFTVPAGVTSVSVLCVGGGSMGGNSEYNNILGTGGSLAYKNSITVSGGQSCTVVVGSGGTAVSGPTINRGENSFFELSGTTEVRARGGTSLASNIGTVSYDGGIASNYSAGGGGGAAGYSAAGGTGGYGTGNGTNGTAATGGGGGGAGGGYTEAQYPEDPFTGYIYEYGGGGGGGVGILGAGSNGSGGAAGGYAGGGGSGGSAGSTSGTNFPGGNGGAYGGGGGQAGAAYFYPAGTATYYIGGNGAVGAVRIIWGTGRSYPSNAANV
jgi:hypothetical protein